MKNPFESLQNWTHEVLNAIKRDIKVDHLHTDPVFYRKHFGNRPQNRLTAEEIFAAYEKELIEGNQELSEWVVNRWVFKHGDLYQHFAERLSQVNPEFNQIERLNEEESEAILKGAEKFEAIPTFLFALLNGVVFPASILERLRQAAEVEKAAQSKQQVADNEQKNLEKIIAAHQREIARMQDRIDGVQKKYTRDTEALKKQIKALQKR